MKKVFALTLAALTFSSVSHAWIIKGNNTPSPSQPVSRGISVEDCSDSLYQSLSTFSSSTDAACSYGRTDREFQRCTISIAQEIGHQYVQLAGQACAAARNTAEANCAIDLYFRGGLYVSNNSMSADGVRVCSHVEKDQLKSCVINQYQTRGKSGVDAARICLEQFDPAVKARREAEQKRIEAEKRAAEAKRQEELRRQEEQRRQQQQAEQKKKDEEARKKEEERKRQEQQQQQQQTQPSAPISTPDVGGGVIVDLPNFE